MYREVDKLLESTNLPLHLLQASLVELTRFLDLFRVS